MAAEKKGKSTIVIKKIYVAAGHHGGAWKVALADFMTALMAFFLVMWLLGQSEQTKKAVSDYFSTPSILEYNFQNYGVEITLEKLFLDFVNEPLKAIESFLEPIDRTPNVLDFGSQKVVAAFMADQLLDIVESGQNLKIDYDGLSFDILDTHFFIKGTATPNEMFVTNTEKMKGVTTGLEDSILKVEMRLFEQSVENSDINLARLVAQERVEIFVNKIKAQLESNTVDVVPVFKVAIKEGYTQGQSRPNGLIHIEIKQKPIKSNGEPYRKLDTVFGKPENNVDVYQNFVKQITKSKKESEAEAAEEAEQKAEQKAKYKSDAQ